MPPPPLAPQTGPSVANHQSNGLSKVAAEAGLLLSLSPSLLDRLGLPKKSSSNMQEDDDLARRYAQMALVLARFIAGHEANWRLCELYGCEAKRAWVEALLTTLAAIRNDDQNTGLQHQAAAEAHVLLCLRTALRERNGAEAASTSQALSLYLSSLQDSRRPQLQASVPHNALRCLMNASGQRPEVQQVLWSLQGPSQIYHTLAQGVGVLSCEALSLGLRLLYHTCASVEGGFHRLKPQSHHWLELLVPVLAWAVRCPSPPFPQGLGRVEVVQCSLRCLFALSSSLHTTHPPQDSTLMTQLGVLLVEVLLLPPPVPPVVHHTKIEVCKLLLQCPVSFFPFLLYQGGLCPLLDLLAWLTETVTVEKTGSPGVELCPVLALLTSLCEHSPKAVHAIKQAIFPPLPPKSAMLLEEAQAEAPGPAMEPCDAPRHSLRSKLIRLMQVSDVTTQRLAAELVYVMCGKDADEFVVRTGFGSAAGLLQVKGVLQVPAS